MKRQALAIGLGILLLGGSAKADESITQTRVSVTVGVPNFGHAANDLREVSESFDARLENLNMDSASGTGSATFKVKPGQVAQVMSSLEKVGQLQNQSQSSSDYTASVAQYERKIKAFRAMAQIDAASLFSKLPAEQRAEVITEFQSFVNNSLQSNESSATSYRDMGKVVEISISLTTKPLATPPANDPPVANPVATPTTPEAPAAPPFDSRPLYLLCLLNFLGMWAIYRRIDRPEPLAPSPHTH